MHSTELSKPRLAAYSMMMMGTKATMKLMAL